MRRLKKVYVWRRTKRYKKRKRRQTIINRRVNRMVMAQYHTLQKLIEENPDKVQFINDYCDGFDWAYLNWRHTIRGDGKKSYKRPKNISGPWKQGELIFWEKLQIVKKIKQSQGWVNKEYRYRDAMSSPDKISYFREDLPKKIDINYELDSEEIQNLDTIL